MIVLSASTAFMVYLGLTIGVLLGMWLWQHYRSKRKVILPSETKLNVCEFCHFAYLGESAKQISKCPQCHSFNKN